jgi:hypothetical protein
LGLQQSQQLFIYWFETETQHWHSPLHIFHPRFVGPFFQLSLSASTNTSSCFSLATMIAPDPKERVDPSLRIRGMESSDTLRRENSSSEKQSSSKRLKTKNHDLVSSILREKHGYHRGKSETFVEPSQQLSIMLDKQDNIKKKKEKEDSTDSFVQDVRLKLKKFIMTSFLGHRYMNILLGLSIFSCCQFIYQTYLDENNEMDKKILDFFGFLELILAGLFAFDWCLWLFLADDRVEQLLRYANYSHTYSCL